MNGAGYRPKNGSGAQSGGTFGCRSFFIFMSETKGGLLIKKMKLEIKDREICRFFVR